MRAAGANGAAGDIETAVDRPRGAGANGAAIDRRWSARGTEAMAGSDGVLRRGEEFRDRNLQ